MKNYMNIAVILCFVVLVSFLPAKGQVHKAEIGVNGLTCSFCTRSVEMELRKLNFVEDVNMNLAETRGSIVFKPDETISPKAIQKAVKNAGFSLRYIYLYMDLSVLNPKKNKCFDYQGTTYQFLNEKEKLEQGRFKVQLLRKGMMPNKAFKVWKSSIEKSKQCHKDIIFIRRTDLNF